MLLFTLKKWFFDMWDSILKLLLLNALSITVLVLPFSLPGWMAGAGLPPAFGLGVFAVGILVMLFLFAGVVHTTWLSAEYQPWGGSEFFRGAKSKLGISILFVLSNAVVFLLLRNAVPFYLGMENMPGYAAVAVLFWVGVFWVMTAQYFFPIHCRMGDGFLKTWKKSLLVALDNPGFSLFLFILLTAAVIVSELTAYMFPGIFGVVLLLQGAGQLRLKKYDYLEENPDAKASRIPWRAVLQDDRRKVGKRTLKGMFFPWKE
ncbi:hypothetical protein [Spirochaeta africana]|uniref:Uncharacterized protein n=1 Tax=Spirochaeta africana (strain ATCC 700263 / DSM 8902 / Z-7692) TaxID=889378 RepID=H9UJ52_SPIAZ|nr:hypothetical protein [Spirochaeta africana]AFG37545.1 hypothetical protein Spiaf_1484 [Spirochaeta africana DSM 8902]